MPSAVDQAEHLLQDGGPVHLMGIGGIGMAGLAFLLKARGLTVSGCDLQQNRQTAWLEAEGIPVEIGHAADHVREGVGWVIRSTAVPDDHPEAAAAKAAGLPMLRRGEVLPALLRGRESIAVCGTHGKTTTTAMLAQVLNCGCCIGGEIDGMDGVARDGDRLVVEADESDGTLVGYAPDYAVITNIEYDHMEHHASAEAFIDCFRRLIEQTRRTVFYCAEDPIANELCRGRAHCVPYGFPDPPIELPLPGRHNQLNAAAALTVCRQWMPEAEVREALRTLSAVRRRFETVYEDKGIRVVSDYAHHPTEIAALIQTARESGCRRLLAIFQPHRYTRTRSLGDDFPAAFEGLDHLWITPVYAASEAPLPGGTSDDLYHRFPEMWKERLALADSLDSAWNSVVDHLQEGDLLLLIGAGDIEQLADRARRL